MPGFLTGLQEGGGGGMLKKAAGKIRDKIKGTKGKEMSSGDDSWKGEEKNLTGDSYKKGGPVRKTGLAKVHKGEFVLTKGQTKRLAKAKGMAKRTARGKC